MQFTYDAYKGLLEKLKSHGYQTANYTNWDHYDRCVILRHDIDNDIEKAVEMASLERDGGVVSTYFVLLTSDFYNIFSQKAIKGLKKIHSLGQEIGLHFDEMQYGDNIEGTQELCEKIRWEAGLLGEAVGCPVRVVSMHRPSQAVLASNLQIPGMINSYGRIYFQEFKYLSDSRRRWREPVEKVIESGKYKRLHILTHAFWYHEKERAMEDVVSSFVNTANWIRYQSYENNFTNLLEVMSPDQVQGIRKEERLHAD